MSKSRTNDEGRQVLDPEVAGKILDADFQNVVKKVAAGKPLTVAERSRIESLAAGSNESLAYAKTLVELAAVLGVTRRTLTTWQKMEELPQQTPLVFGGDLTKAIDSEDQPFSEEHDWEPSRYAGVYTYLITLIYLNNWLELVMKYFGDKFKIFLVFLLLFARGMRSVEQIKNVNRREAGLVLGIGRLPIRQQVHGCLHSACKMEVSNQLLEEYFRKQVTGGEVSTRLWFTDGHLC
jgi:hypothetical protein